MYETKRIIGGKIVLPDRIINNGVIWIKDGLIVDINKRNNIGDKSYDIDASGLWVLPGIIDSHCDAIENEIEPRPYCFIPIEIALNELEKRFISCGITTIYHSISLFHREAQDWARKNENIRILAREIKRLSLKKNLINHKVHLRFEINNIEAIPIVKELIADNMIDELSFMDHTPGQGQYRDLEIHRKTIKGMYKLTDEEIDKRVEKILSLPVADIDTLKNLAKLAEYNHIPLASHDDDSIEKLNLIKEWNTSICEFPIDLDVAMKAKEMGFYITMGATNMLLGRSTGNNLSAREALKYGALDILCSDYYPPSIIHSIFFLNKLGYPMNDIVNMTSLNPAKALGIEDKFGSIEPDKEADIIMVNANTDTPFIEKVLVNGDIRFDLNYNISYKMDNYKKAEGDI